MNRVVHFEISADDTKRASNFYSKVFGWKFDQWKGGTMEYWMIVTGEKDVQGINGGLYKRTKPLSGDNPNAFICTIEVDSFDNYSKKIIDNKGKVFVKKGPIPGMGWIGQFKDTEGNIFGLMQSDKNVK